MCGIGGFCSFAKDYTGSPETYSRILNHMHELQAHRGPDDHGILLAPHAGLSSTAIKLAVAGKVHDEEIAAGLFDRTKLVLGTDGKVAGLDEQLKNLQKEKAFLFKEDAPAPGAGSGAGAPGSPEKRKGGFYKPRNGETHEDSYASQFAKERNEADKNSSKGSLWGEE